MTDLTSAEIEELKRLEKAATSGPWSIQCAAGEWIIRGSKYSGINGYIGGLVIGTDEARHTATFIASARNAVPAADKSIVQ